MSVEGKHTLLPWSVGEYDKADVFVPIAGPERQLAAGASIYPDGTYAEDYATAEANARLIVQAVNSYHELLEALRFYADPEAWNQPPVKTIAHELLGPAYENQASKVRSDRGRVARAAISKATMGAG